VPGPERNEPCPCGSGRTVGRCCGQQRGPTKPQLQREFIAYHAREAAARLRTLPIDEVNRVFDEMLERAEVDLGLTITLPSRTIPDLQRLYDAVRDRDQDPSDEILQAILKRLDSLDQRARLTREIIRLRDSERLDVLLACAAIVDLDSVSQDLLRGCLIHTARVNTGQSHNSARARTDRNA
jgi:hypothetical protein